MPNNWEEGSGGGGAGGPDGTVNFGAVRCRIFVMHYLIIRVLGIYLA